MRTLKVTRATYTKDGYVLSSQTRDVEFLRVVADAKGANPKVGVWFPGEGAVYLSVNSGWGEKPIKSFRLSDEDLELLQDECKALSFKVRRLDTSPNEKRRGITRPKDAGSAVKQMSLFQVSET